MISCNNRLRLWLYLLNFLLWFCLCRSLFFFLFKITLKYAVKCICVRCNLWFFLLRLYTCSRLRKNCFSANMWCRLSERSYILKGAISWLFLGIRFFIKLCLFCFFKLLSLLMKLLTTSLACNLCKK